jgi:hypothetical protein
MESTMAEPASPRLISILRNHGHCVGFLRSAGPRGFTAYDAAGIPIGIFQDKAAAIEVIRRRPLKFDRRTTNENLRTTEVT